MFKSPEINVILNTQRNLKNHQAYTAAIKLDDGYVKAYARRIVCYQELDQHEDAVRDAEKMHKMEHSRESKQRLRDANIKLKMSKRKDYYKILACSKAANMDEIKKAYKKAALKHHPDRHSHGTEEEKATAEKQFKEVGRWFSFDYFMFIQFLIYLMGI